MSVAGNNFGHNATIHQGNVYHNPRTRRAIVAWQICDQPIPAMTRGNKSFKLWLDEDEGRLLWITGDPGKGKTMLICGIINELAKTTKLEDPESKILLSYFFCQGTDSRINNATAVVCGLIYVLVDQQRSLISHVQEKYDVAGKSLFEDANAWTALSQIFINMLQDPSLGDVILVIDALDECETDQAKLLHLIIQHSSLPRVKWIIASRNGLNIEQKLNAHSSRTLLSLELKENVDCISEAVDTYIEHSVSQLDLVQDDPVLQDELRKAMRQKVNGTFLWVSLVMKELEHVESWEVLQVVDEMPSDLKEVYGRMMNQIQQLKRGNPEYCRQLLSTVCATYRPLSLQELGFLSGLPRGISERPGSLRRIVTMCGSFLTIRDENVYLVHQSAKDYLSTEALHTIFPDGAGQFHHSLFSMSLKGMSEILRRDIYDLNAPGFPIDKVTQPDPDPLATIGYCCVYWIDHLCDGISTEASTPINDLHDNGTVYRFFSKKYLYWLEALSLLHKISSGVAAYYRLDALLQNMKTNQLEQLSDFIIDARRFILQCWKAVERAPLQLYASALLFSPTNSLVRRLFEEEEPKWIALKPTMDANWGPSLQTLEGHHAEVLSIAYSPDGRRLATSSQDKTVKIWDSYTWKCNLTLEGHNDSVGRIVFLSDSRKIISASYGIVKIWDVTVGSCLQTFELYKSKQTHALLSPNGKLAADISQGHGLIIWDLTVTPLRFHTLPTYVSSDHRSVVFSADSQHIARHRDGGTIEIWDIDTKKCIQTLRLDGWVSSCPIALGLNGKQLVSLNNRSIRIWCITTGDCSRAFEDNGDTLELVALSRNGLRIASASFMGVMKIWDTATGKCLQILYGPPHTSYGLPLVFSMDDTKLASSSEDAVRIWDLDTATTSEISETGDFGLPYAIFSKDRRWITSFLYGDGRDVKIWDIANGICSKTFRTNLQLSVSWECLQTLEVVEDSSMEFSSDSQKFAAVQDHSIGYVVKIWDIAKGECLQTLSPIDDFCLIFFSPDSEYFGGETNFGNIDSWEIKTWDIAKGIALQTFKGYEDHAASGAFSSDNQLLALCLRNTKNHRKQEVFTVEIRNATTGICLMKLDISSCLPNLSFDPLDHSLLCTDFGILNLNLSRINKSTMLPLRKAAHYGYGISLDGMWIVNGKSVFSGYPRIIKLLNRPLLGRTLLFILPAKYQTVYN
ncbi:Vegetative incompatibility protein HET-E-1 [Cladobotryum mycophilum]|uniref:Mitochondrial division protein 1 n=1 Tax=Cladobotryum mycophilum TaxID=491253 RepID=A0ABR0SIM3_9HYPO